MSNRRSLVTGGGFIRSHLVRQLLEKGDAMWFVKRSKGFGDSIIWRSIQMDAEKSDFNLVNFEGIRTIFAEVAKHDVEVVVYTSTESILTGNARRNKLVDAAAERRLNEM